MINAVREEVEKWRRIPDSSDWRVTSETARLLQHWRHHEFAGIRPLFCQVKAVETAIWLTEVAPKIGKAGQRFLGHLANANNDANPELMRLALKLATATVKSRAVITTKRSRATTRKKPIKTKEPRAFGYPVWKRSIASSASPECLTCLPRRSFSAVPATGRVHCSPGP